MKHNNLITEATQEQLRKAKLKRGTKLQRMVYTRLIANEAQVEIAKHMCFWLAILFIGLLFVPGLQKEIILSGGVSFFLTFCFLHWKSSRD
jgi:hypothetical protein